jgi:hypothetical protein
MSGPSAVSRRVRAVGRPRPGSSAAQCASRSSEARSSEAYGLGGQEAAASITTSIGGTELGASSLMGVSQDLKSPPGGPS